MEDKSSFKDGIEHDSKCGIWGIYDGHLGSGVALMVKQEMCNMFEKIYAKGGWKDKPELTEEFFKELFQKVNDLADESNIPESGACVSVVVVREEGGKKVLYSANVGDADVYLVESTKEDCHRISTQHKTSNEEEVKRLEAMGTEIFAMGDPEPRVEGMINVTRTIGDYGLKSCGVSYEPYVARFELKEENTHVIVASDGIWDKVKSTKAFEIVHSSENTGVAAKKLIEKAMEERTADNCSVFVIKF